MTMLISLLALALLVWLWQDTLRARERAIQVATATCQQQQLQWLDATVSLQRIRVGRCTQGRACLQRTFVFEYTADGDHRQHGFVLMNGLQVASVGLEPARDDL